MTISITAIVNGANPIKIPMIPPNNATNIGSIATPKVTRNAIDATINAAFMYRSIISPFSSSSIPLIRRAGISANAKSRKLGTTSNPA